MAVYTELTLTEVNEFLANYSIGKAVDLKGIAEGVENSNFLLCTKDNQYILTLYEKRIQKEDLPFFLNLLSYLSQHGIACPVPVIANNGQTLHYVKERYASIVSFLPGKSPKQRKNWHCQQLGHHMARMHLAAKDFSYSRTNALSLTSWHSLAQLTYAAADSVKPGLAEEVKEHLHYITDHWPRSLPAGIIHADLFPDNVFFEDNHLSGIIDFYFACNDFLMYDLAICLNAWCFETNGEFNITKSSYLLAAYNEVRPFTAEEWRALPILAQGAALRFLLTRLYDWLNQVEGALVTPKNPLEYLHKLRFHQGISHPAAYGLQCTF